MKQLKGIHHVGIAVKEPHKMKSMLMSKGWMIHGEGVCKKYATYCIFLTKGKDLIELCVGLNETSPITKYLEKHPEGLHHIALNKKFKDGDDGALKGMKIRFDNLRDTANLLIEEVYFEK